MKRGVGKHTKSHVFSRKAFCLPLLFTMGLFTFLSSMSTSMAATVEENTGTKEERAKDIAIVFDNSGTMFAQENLAWCRAQYAMEVFADMANEGDEITIYPMNAITVDGTEYTMDNPLKVENPSQIHNIKPVSTGGDTPIETIDRAYAGLMADADDKEKWLVIVTDGARFYQETNGRLEEMSKSDTVAELTARLTSYNDAVNVLYLGIDSPNASEDDDKTAANPGVTGTGNYVGEVKIATESSEILERLTEMCNIMYGRDTLDANHAHSDGTVDFDLSMTKLILFVQGNNISNLKLLDEQGNEAGTPVSSYNPQYVTLEGYASDDELSGQIVTYEDVPAGTYTVSYDGNPSSEEVYYEPDASIYLALTNEDGEDVLAMSGGEVEPGSYQLRYGLEDANGNLTDSSLLGDRTFSIAVNGEPVVEDETLQDACGIHPIELEEGEDLYVEVDADYLSGYHVHTDSNKEWSQHPLQVIPEYEPYELSADMKADSYYSISRLADAEPIEVLVTHEGEPLTPEQMELTELTLDVDDLDSSDWTITKDADNSRFLITPKVGKSDAGYHKVNATVTTYDEDNEEYVQTTTDKTIQYGKYPKWLRWAIALAIIILIIVIILIIMNTKVLPKKINVVQDESYFKVGRNPVGDDCEAHLRRKRGGKTGTLTISSPSSQRPSQSISLQIKAVDPRRVKSCNRRINIVSYSGTPNGASSFSLGGVGYSLSRRENIFVRDGDDPDVTRDSEDIDLSSGWIFEMEGKERSGGRDKKTDLSVTLRYR